MSVNKEIILALFLFGQGHGIVPMERACHKDYAFQLSMLYH